MWICLSELKVSLLLSRWCCWRFWWDFLSAVSGASGVKPEKKRGAGSSFFIVSRKFCFSLPRRLNGTYLKEASLNRARLIEASLDRAYIREVKCSACNFHVVSLDKVTIDKQSYDNMVKQGAKFIDAKIINDENDISSLEETAAGEKGK